ncbi:hypothetical protein C0J52_23197 [Blattella germanica]|nr:hypothetical protein C0J52_23197 [Blattella germanica]
MQVSSINIMDTIEGRRLTWYGHLRRMPTDRWPLKIYNWIPPRRKKRGRPRLSWNNNVRQTMDVRQMTDEDWKDRNVDAYGVANRQQQQQQQQFAIQFRDQKLYITTPTSPRIQLHSEHKCVIGKSMGLLKTNSVILVYLNK